MTDDDQIIQNINLLVATKKTNLEAMNKLIELQKNNETMKPEEYERYITDLYRKNLDEFM